MVARSKPLLKRSEKGVVASLSTGGRRLGAAVLRPWAGIMDVDDAAQAPFVLPALQPAMAVSLGLL